MHLFLRHTRPLPALSLLPNLLAMSNVCAAVSSASNSAAVSTIDAESRASKARLRGVVFDMDGTLTVPVIDIQAMYKAVLGEELYKEVRLKNPSVIDILHQIEGWNPDQQKKAYEVIAMFEKDGIDHLQIMPAAAGSNKAASSSTTLNTSKLDEETGYCSRLILQVKGRL